MKGLSKGSLFFCALLSAAAGPAFADSLIDATKPERLHEIARGFGSAELDKPALIALAKQTIEGYFAGRVNGSIESAGDSVQASFTGTFHNRAITGRLRATQYEHDMVIVAAVSPNPESLSMSTSGMVGSRPNVRSAPSTWRRSRCAAMRSLFSAAASTAPSCRRSSKAVRCTR